ncbi:hypothetical protein GcM3_170017 [Golovinomyces cichoracearum]|uniref:Uncharacterized protein n=1 Tax=Golovinomyces cichoracearum TaxID=62708 RepID=A0A420HR91_9PEZI|nr:hypothetical protein GcM3_170017 [Golovinomyces cichoracearum]
MHCLAIMWITAIGGGIFERAVMYNIEKRTNILNVQSDSTYRSAGDSPRFATLIKDQIIFFNQNPMINFLDVEWGKAKYFYGNNYLSFCNAKLGPVENLRRLSYEFSEEWTPPWDFDNHVPAQQISMLGNEIEAIKEERMLRVLISLAKKGRIRLEGKTDFFINDMVRKNAKTIRIPNGVPLWLVGLNKYLDTQRLNHATYAFTIDNVYGFRIATLMVNKLQYSHDNLYNFLRDSASAHSANGKICLRESIIYDPYNYYI